MRTSKHGLTHLRNELAPERRPAQLRGLTKAQGGDEPYHRAVVPDEEPHLVALAAGAEELEVLRELLQEDARGQLVVGRRVLGVAPDVAAVGSAHSVIRDEGGGVLVFEVADREDGAGVLRGDALACGGVAGQGMAVARPRREGIEEVVIWPAHKRTRGERRCGLYSHQTAQSERPVVPSIASSRILSGIFSWRWSVHAGTDWYASRMSLALLHG